MFFNLQEGGTWRVVKKARHITVEGIRIPLDNESSNKWMCASLDNPREVKLLCFPQEFEPERFNFRQCL